MAVASTGKALIALLTRRLLWIYSERNGLNAP
ncbi:hypothetical protein SHXM_06301 [Streptomyces hygroscopicus]|nr:hypothetical protein SHXM_06301 [Streptomyces hygroscopicus]